MPTPYEFGYGEVTFETEDGAPLFSTTADLGLWTAMDEEPSPEPKWVRVSVPGADGAVDLSRALTGQVQYESREIRLRFEGDCGTHADALALVHRMRRALHGARVRVTTMLTAQVGGWYLADCECDGTADAQGGVTVDVTGTADPFIRIGAQSLALPFSAAASEFSPAIAVPEGRDASIATYYVDPLGPQMGYVCPIGADEVRLWWARGDNLFDASLWPWASNALGAGVSNGTVGFYGAFAAATHVEVMAAGAPRGEATWPAWPYSFPFGSFEGRPDKGIAPSGVRLVARVLGVLTYAGSGAAFRLTAVANATGVSGGLVQGATTSASVALSAGAVDEVVAIDLAAATWSGGDATALSAIRCEVEGGVSGSLAVDLMLTCGASDEWAAPDLGWEAVTLDAPIGWYESVGKSDQVQVSPVRVQVNHKVTHSGGMSTATSAEGTVGTGAASGMPPADATHVTATLSCEGGPSNAVAVWAQMPETSTATGENATMRSTPAVTSDEGAMVTIGGRTAVVGPGTVALPALAIPGGEFEVEYAIFGGGPGGAVLTWEGGAL